MLEFRTGIEVTIIDFEFGKDDTSLDSSSLKHEDSLHERVLS
jgi:hypothetical protein